MAIVNDVNKLIPPCSYQGGKTRLASSIIDEIFKNSKVNEDTKFYDLCCGSGAITLELVNRGIHPTNITMVDMGMFGLFWNSVANNEFDIDKLRSEINKLPETKDIQMYLKEMSRERVDNDKSVYQYLLLQAGSFGSKQVWVDNGTWKHSSFRSYWKPTLTSNRKSPVNPMMPMPETILNRTENIVNELGGIINAINSDIGSIDWKLDDNSIVYIDPPYNNTTRYGYNFDYLNFVDKYNEMCDIYISERESINLGNKSVILQKGRDKGGISGSRKTAPNEEWLNYFKMIK